MTEPTWYKCECGQLWEAPGHTKPNQCPECDKEGEIDEK